MSKGLKITFSILILAVFAVFMVDPSKYMASFFNGVTIWATNVLPAIFPFMLLAKLFVSFDAFSGHFTKQNFFTRLLNTPPVGVYAMLLSMLCGYPVGAKIISELHSDKTITTTQCKKLLSFCSTAGPIFIVGTIGIKTLNSPISAIVILFSHLTSNVLNGVIYRGRFVDQTKNIAISRVKNEKGILNSALLDSLNSILTIGGLVAVFYMLCDMIYSFLPAFLVTDGQIFTAFALGILEMTNGCLLICQTADLFTATVLCSSIVSFGGLCVLMQCMTFLSTCQIKISTAITMKITHSALCTLICFALAFVCRVTGLM